MSSKLPNFPPAPVSADIAELRSALDATLKLQVGEPADSDSAQLAYAMAHVLKLMTEVLERMDRDWAKLRSVTEGP